MATLVKHNIAWKRRTGGLKRRLENVYRILDGDLSLPKPVEYEDIDNSFKDWTNTVLSIQFDGKELPTFTLYSNQRISEYTQSWQYLDETNNFLMNFKTVTRENNPKSGTIYGEKANIPGNRKYLIGIKEVMQENGLVGYDAYSMTQPFAVDLQYKISIITNKYELLNQFNMMVVGEFKAKQAYIFPNGHAMSMILGDITDESEYNINNRKFYSQTYSITVRAYIIRKEDFTITHLPNRMNLYTTTSQAKHHKRKKTNVMYIDTDEGRRVIIDCTNDEQVTTFTYEGANNLDITNIELQNVDDIGWIQVNGEIVENLEEKGLVIQPGDRIAIQFTKDFNESPNTITLTGSIQR